MASFASEVGITQSAEFFSRFGRFGGTMARLQQLLGDDEFMEWWVKQLDKFPHLILASHLFTKPEVQIARVRELNLERGWGISDQAFVEAEKSVPTWPEGKLVAVTLVPYLADKKAEDGTVTTGVEHTFHELCEVVVSARYRKHKRVNPDGLHLLNGIEHPAKAGQANPALGGD